MKGMLIKDFSLLKGQKQFFMVAFMFAVLFLFLSDMATFGVSYLIIMFIIFTLSTIAYDEYDNGNAFLFTLPISRKRYVQEKYVFCLVVSAIICFINMILIFILSYVKGYGKDDVATLLITMAAAWAAGILMLSIMIPLQLKFGSEKRQMAMVAGFVCCFFLVFVGKKLVDRFGVPAFIGKLGSLSLGSVIGIGAVLLIVITVVSYLLAVRIQEKKEF